MLAIGLMSGTSLDGVDCALVDIDGVDESTSVRLVAFATYEMPAPIGERIMEACRAGGGTTRLLCSLNVELGHLFSDAVGRMCRDQSIDASSLGFVATHGQTVWHEPDASRDLGDGKRYHASTLQLGEPAIIAFDHNVRVVSNFRPMDMAAGGQGAPLVPFSEVVLYGSATKNRVLLNVGGIGNVTALPRGRSSRNVFAFDTGPGNMMVDEACRRLFGVPFDEGGAIAARGQVDGAMLDDLLSEPYFACEPPKSTGRELFGAAAVGRVLEAHPDVAAEDVVAIFTELTARSIADACRDFVKPRLDGGLDELIVGGGGAHNATLVGRLSALMPGTRVLTQEDLGFSSDAKEAVAFAILGNQTIHGRPSNVPSATGARMPVVLGNITNPPRSF